jgi:hypothetical protein
VIAERLSVRKGEEPMPLHKFNVGDIVALKPVNRNVPAGFYEVVKQLPGSSEPEYRIKSIHEPHQRVAREGELLWAR